MSMKGKGTVIQQVKNGKKKYDVCQEFGIVNSTIDMV